VQGVPRSGDLERERLHQHDAGGKGGQSLAGSASGPRACVLQSFRARSR
jgi:hypothetical protein